jgi:predicted NAD-dependent protein-ADP-ribosyltransferase YbiA (DUF1768 family)
MASEISFVINPANDGIDHINIYSKGQTILGRTLSNFKYAPFVCDDGPFDSVEGYWYFLQVNDNCPDKERLREVNGYNAKNLGRELRNLYPNPITDQKEFEMKILTAISKKLTQNKVILDLLVESGDLPLTHYYVYGNGTNAKVVETKGSEFIISFLEKTRTHFQNLKKG